MPTSYLICAVQRSGSWMLSHALEDTGVAGIPAEYFHPGDMPGWAERWGTTTQAEYFASMVEQTSTPNGVFGSKMMWNYFGEARARLRRLDCADGARSDTDVLERFLPSLRYIWLRRHDTLRQAVSWWRAVESGQYAIGRSEAPNRAPLPPYDFDALRGFVGLCEDHDRAWQQWFASYEITPLELFYENIVDDLPGAVVAVLRHLNVAAPQDLGITPRMWPQADEHTDAIVNRFRTDESSRF